MRHLLTFLGLGVALLAPTQGALPSVTTISDSLKLLLPGFKRNVILDLEPVFGQVLTHPSLASLTGDKQRNQIISLLKDKTKATQEPVLKGLEALGLKDRVQSFWVANRILVKDADFGLVQAISKIPGTSFVIREPVKVKIYDPMEPANLERFKRGNTSNSTLQYGVEKIKAAEVWATGNKGEGIVVAIIDTGVNSKHVALKDNYKNDDASWYDAFKQYKEPYDGNMHGTHCAGTIAGQTNGIGVAPGAKWIACRGLDDEGSGDESTLLACGEFVACPSGNTTGTCSGFPHVVSNSWGGLVGGSDFYNPVVDVWQSLKIVPVFALGNSGPLCMTSGSPGDQENLIAVGATDKYDKVATFSSRGPALASGKRKPEVSAPGKDIVSATHDSNDGYRKLSGTSMACPHVAGAVALMLHAKPDADFKLIQDTLEKTADKPKLGFFDPPKVCSLPAGYPNNAYGSGRINVKAAVDWLLKADAEGTTTTTGLPTTTPSKQG